MLKENTDIFSNTNVYSRIPNHVLNGIPVFSDNDEYIENYEKIASDHMNHFFQTGSNPFMQEESWSQAEKDTIELCFKLIDCAELYNVLDVGVGTGRLLDMFRSHCDNKVSYFGMDIAYNYLKFTAQKGINCCLSKIEDMPYRDNLFDVVFCTDVLEHVVDLMLCTKNIVNVIKEGGYLVCRVPYKENLSGYLSDDYPYQYAHLRSFDLYSLQLLFQKIFGLNYIGHSYTMYIIDFWKQIPRFPLYLSSEAPPPPPPPNIYLGKEYQILFCI